MCKIHNSNIYVLSLKQNDQILINLMGEAEIMKLTSATDGSVRSYQLPMLVARMLDRVTLVNTKGQCGNQARTFREMMTYVTKYIYLFSPSGG